ncbi:MAG: mechanosensitive ion channel protein MscS, partial [Nitrosopumilaceae archaeon]|nr:mechanosensitive ion channel protein MscS [Nitrosopumilaceae archaeon]
MAEEDLSQISVGEFENVSQLLVSSESLQFAFILMVAGIIGIVLGYGKFSGWVKSQKIYYARPHLARFIRRAILPVFAIALITSTNAYMQTSGVFEQDVGGDGDLSAEATFAKILNTFNILVIGYTVSHLIPIALTKREKSTLEKEDFDA